jgi:hypothetical protein
MGLCGGSGAERKRRWSRRERKKGDDGSLAAWPPRPGQEKVQEQEQEQDSCFPARVGRSTHRVLPRLAKLTKHLGPCRAGTTTTQGHC